MDALALLTDYLTNCRIKFYITLEKCWKLEILHEYRSKCANPRKNQKTQNLSIPVQKKNWNVRAVLYNWLTADWIKEGFL